MREDVLRVVMQEQSVPQSVMKTVVQILVGQGYLEGPSGSGNIEKARRKFEEALTILNDNTPWNVTSHSPIPDPLGVVAFPLDSASLGTTEALPQRSLTLRQTIFRV